MNTEPELPPCPKLATFEGDVRLFEVAVDEYEKAAKNALRRAKRPPFGTRNVADAKWWRLKGEVDESRKAMRAMKAKVRVAEAVEKTLREELEQVIEHGA